MPANLFTETLPVNTNLEDQRALHLAFELSMLGLDEDSGSNVNAISDADAEILRKNNANGANMTECVPVPSSEHVAEMWSTVHSFIKMTNETKSIDISAAS
jgi:hypothetical protein